MATRKYSINVGDAIQDITQATGSSTTAGIECTVDLAKFTHQNDLILALENLKSYIIQKAYP